MAGQNERLMLKPGAQFQAIDQTDLTLRTFQLTRPLSGDVVTVEIATQGIFAEVIVWEIREIITREVLIDNDRTSVTDLGETLVVKFYNPGRTVIRNIGNANTNIDFFYDQENYISRNLEDVQGIVKIVATGLVDELQNENGMSDVSPARRFVVQTTLVGSRDLLKLSNLIQERGIRGQQGLPMYVQVALAKVFQDIMVTVDKMHLRGKMHQDVKQENIVIGSPAEWDPEQTIEEWNELTTTPVVLAEPPPNFLMMLVELSAQSEFVDEATATAWVKNQLRQGLVQTLVIDIDRSRAMDGLEDLYFIGLDGTEATLDPWLFFTLGNIPEYPFDVSTPAQRVWAAMMAADYWALGVTMFEMLNGFNPLQSPDPVQIEQALGELTGYPSLDTFPRGDAILDLLDEADLAETLPNILAVIARLENPDTLYQEAAGFLVKTQGQMRMVVDRGLSGVWNEMSSLLSLDVADRFRDRQQDKPKTLDVLAKTLNLLIQ